LVTPADFQQDYHVSDENKSIAEDKTEVGRESKQKEELCVPSKSCHGRVQAEEATVEHLSKLEVAQEDQNWQPGLSLGEKVEPFDEDLVFHSDLLSEVC